MLRGGPGTSWLCRCISHPCPFLSRAHPGSLCPSPCPCVLLCVPVTGQTPPARPSWSSNAPFVQISPSAWDKTPRCVCSRFFSFCVSKVIRAWPNQPFPEQDLPAPPRPGMLKAPGQGWGCAPALLSRVSGLPVSPSRCRLGQGQDQSSPCSLQVLPLKPEPGRARLASRSLPKPDFIVIVHTLMFSLQPWNPSLYFSSLPFPGTGCCLPLPRHHF